ncbi:MAG: hypothetical protein ACREQD_00330, partial [Candidatus Binataceae bacterium]
MTLAILPIANFGCNSNVEAPGAFSVRTADCLPDIVLTDQNNHAISLASLKGKPVFFDFIYTT